MAKPKVEKMARWIVLLATFSLIAAACGSGDSSTASGSSETGTDEQDQTEQLANLCDLFTEARLASLDEGMDSILPGATQDSIARVGETCVIQYSSGDDSIVLTIHPEGVFATDDFLPGGDITTDAIRLSAVNTEMGEVVVEAETSDPAGIITWDASFLGAFALQM